LGAKEKPDGTRNSAPGEYTKRTPRVLPFLNKLLVTGRKMREALKSKGLEVVKTTHEDHFRTRFLE